MKFKLPCPQGFEESLKTMSIADLVKLQDQLTREKWVVMGKARAVASARANLEAEDHAAEHGLTPDQYLAVKEIARSGNIPLSTALREFRKTKTRELQVVKTKELEMPVKAESTMKSKKK